MKDLKTYVNESKNPSLEKIARQLYDYLKKDQHFINSKENAMEFLDILEDMLKEYNMSVMARWASGVIQHTKDKY